MDLPVVEHSKQKRPSLKADPISELIRGSSGQEQALYVLLAASGMRISEALALETKHFINNGRTIMVEQQVEKDTPRIVLHLKTNAAKREIDLHPDIAEYLRKYITGRTGLLFSHSKWDALSSQQTGRPLAHSQTHKNGAGAERRGLACIQAIPQNMVAWTTLSGGHQ